MLCSEITISNKTRSTSVSTDLLLNQLSDLLSKANGSYDVILTGEFNIDTGISNSDHDKLEAYFI